ncbi:MAG: CotH kinase family protein [Coriobacteriia bacterium]|nr:CotH kinase family protein [Coriobacteriia bacterium]
MEERKNLADCLLRAFLSIVLVSTLCFVVPTTASAEGANDADSPSGAVDGNGSDDGSQGTDDADQAAGDTGDSGQGADGEDESAEVCDYESQNFANLYDAGQLELPEGAKAETVALDESANGLLLSGPADALATDGIGVTKTFNFDDKEVVSRIRVQAVTARKTSAKLACYLDGELLSTFELSTQKKKGNWDPGTEDYCLDISKKSITGEHSVSFKIIDTGKTGSSETQQILLKNFEFMKFSVPVINFNIDESKGHTVADMNSSDDHSVECYGSIDISVPDNWTSEYTGKHEESQSYELDYVRGRGNSTWGANTTHRPYKVKLDKKAGLLGMGKSKHWTLIANYYDNSQLHNKMTYWLSEQLGMEYTVKLEPVEVVMDGEYYGSYYLCEQVRVGESCIDIDDLESDEGRSATEGSTITGGYLLNLGESGSSKQDFDTQDASINWSIESPSFDEHSEAAQEAQYNYIKNYIDETEEALYSDTFKNSEGKRYDEYLDLDSSVDYLWLQEFTMNGDAYAGGSTYLYKKRDTEQPGKLYFGPAWDFDYVAWGNLDYDDEETGDTVEAKVADWSQNGKMWVGRLLKDEVFASKFISRWKAFKQKLDELFEEGGQFDWYKQRIETAVSYNCEKYGFTEHFGADTATDVTFDDETQRLRNWVQLREKWVDAHLEQLRPDKYTVTYKNGSSVLKTETIYAGDCLVPECEEPTKEGSTFVGWQISYHASLEQYLKANSLTWDELVKQVGETEANKIKENGYSFSTIYEEGADGIPIPGDVTVSAVFKANKSDSGSSTKTSSLLGSIITKKGIRYQVTCTKASFGRSVKVVGLSNKKKKSITIPKSIKIKGKKYLVTEIGTKAFAGCKKLKLVKIKSKSLFVRNKTFKSLPKKAKVKVPKSSLRHYKSVIKCRKVRKL